MWGKRSMNPDKNKIAKKVFFIAVVVSLFCVAIIQVSSDEELVKYSDLERQEIGNDSESQETLQEYYGEVLGSVKTEAKFNTIATKEDIAVLNVTIGGKDTRILTRVETATVSGQNLLNATLVRTINLIVLGNISLKGNLFFDAEKSFGLRRFYGVGSTTFRYIDEGFARLVNGKANVSINPALRELISGYNVFLSAEGLTKGIYVAEKTGSYFIVKSINPASNVGFSWMLRGVKKDSGEKLDSAYGKEKGIGIRATINFEDGTTKIRIDGLDKIIELYNKTAVRGITTRNETANTAALNKTANRTSRGITLVTGNLIDEFGLETDLGRILGEATPLPNLTEETGGDEIDITEEEIPSETTLDDTAEETISNETVLENITEDTLTVSETEPSTGISYTLQGTSVLEFMLYSTNEDFIISQVADVTGLSAGEVMKLINFVYAEPEGFEDETIEDLQLSLDYIEKVNGSVVIKLG
jgi:hypothetical protein